jgi:cysteine-rich repeat protein
MGRAGSAGSRLRSAAALWLVVPWLAGCGADASDATGAGTAASGGATGAGGGVGAGASAATGSGGGAPACGNGVIEPGERCDDGNEADGDFCSAACEPAVVVLEGPTPSNVSTTSVGATATAGRFALLWERPAPGAALRYAVLESSGAAAAATTELGEGAAAVIGAGADGSGLVVWREGGWLRHRRIEIGGSLAPEAAPTADATFFPIARPASAAAASLCVLASIGSLRCTGPSGLGPALSISPPSGGDTYHVQSAHLVPHAGGLAVSYVVASGAKRELRVLPVTGDGQPAGGELVLGASSDPSLVAAGGVAVADGGVGLAYGGLGGIHWFPFDAAGLLVSSGVVPIHAGGLSPVIAAHASGSFVLGWREVVAAVDPSAGTTVSTCHILGQIYGADLVPIGAPFSIYAAAEGHCATSYSLALDAAGNLAAIWYRTIDGSGATLPRFVEAIILPRVLRSELS